MSRPGDYIENEQGRHKELVRARLERIWTINEGIFAGLDHQLIVIAVPTYPADLEAVSAMDLSDIADIMATFAKKRSEDDGTEPMERVKPEGEASPTPAGDALDSPGLLEREVDRVIRARSAQSLGQGNDRGGAPQERPEPAVKQAEGDAAPDPVGRPVFELIPANGDPIIHIWASGRIDNFDGSIINRLPGSFPPMVSELTPEDIERLVPEWAMPSYVTYDQLTPSIMDPPGTPLRREGFNAGEPIWPDNDQSNDLDIDPAGSKPSDGSA